MKVDLPEGVKLASFKDKNLPMQEVAKQIGILWSEMAPYPALFGDDGLRDPRAFVNFILSPTTVVLEMEFGYIFICRIIPGLRAEVHLYIKDHKLSAHAELLKEILIWGFLELELERVETFLPEQARTVQRFLKEKMGFKREGIMRKRVLLEGRAINTHIY